MVAEGSIDRFRSLPIARTAVLAGRTLSDLSRTLLTLLLMTAVGALLGFRWQTSLLGMLGGLADCCSATPGPGPGPWPWSHC
jgi:hypothetical protein